MNERYWILYVLFIEYELCIVWCNNYCFIWYVIFKKINNLIVNLEFIIDFLFCVFYFFLYNEFDYKRKKNDFDYMKNRYIDIRIKLMRFLI